MDLHEQPDSLLKIIIDPQSEEGNSMRFGCCLNMIAKGPDGTGIEYIEALAKAGFDYAELPLAEMMALPDGQFQELVRRWPAPVCTVRRATIFSRKRSG